MKYLYDSYNMVYFVKKKAGKQTVKVMEFRERIKCKGKKDKQPPPPKKKKREQGRIKRRCHLKKEKNFILIILQKAVTAVTKT
mmetsp:Transcript_32520/g.47451  ORF Transcript_32520/g.47451 Transcript_32520/m.47451 type:complete len:83 (+) Transcript_32520:767-1015(+)